MEMKNNKSRSPCNQITRQWQNYYFIMSWATTGLCNTHRYFNRFVLSNSYRCKIFFQLSERMSPKTVWNHKNVVHAWKIGFPHILLRDTLWVNKPGIFVLFRSTFVFQNNWTKIVHVANPFKMVDIKGPSINTRTSLLKSAEASSLFFFCISVWEVLAYYLSRKPGDFI